MDFACNVLGDFAATDLLGDLQPQLQPQPQPHPSVWVLIDAALIDAKRLKKTVASSRWSMSNALGGSPLESFGSHAPQFMALNEASAADANGVVCNLPKLMGIDKRAPAFSVIESFASLADLQNLCAYLALAQVDGDLKVHCRFADTRVLPHLLRALSATQLARVAAVVSKWSWLNHLGELQHWSHPTQAAVGTQIDEHSHLELNMAQFNALMDASEPDTMFALLLETVSELVPAEGRGTFRDVLSAILLTANAHVLTSPNDRWQFVVLSLSCGPKFHEHPDLQPTWAAIKQGGTTLVDEMKHWSDALWAQLEGK